MYRGADHQSLDNPNSAQFGGYSTTGTSNYEVYGRGVQAIPQNQHYGMYQEANLRGSGNGMQYIPSQYDGRLYQNKKKPKKKPVRSKLGLTRLFWQQPIGEKKGFAFSDARTRLFRSPGHAEVQDRQRDQADPYFDPQIGQKLHFLAE